ncbi:replication-relaxation family protein [Thermaerobacillus caldiproteolyticus]|uniref:replication-relaxation family protein n=1 Tax=Thermaerobacillus caldiproteolyticus TaxID=247480 RepID=UPI001F3C5D8F|nr:replication-relaxation family protein [Anoxybacillus caldiproteolyticus]
MSELGALSRSQLQHMFDLGSKRNANRILQQMSQYLHHVRLNENVYYLNKKGRELIGSKKEFRKNGQLEHTLMRNDIYIFYHYPKDWKAERKTEWRENGKEYKIISDARFTYHDQMYFLEVDLQQQMMKNKQKIELYASLFRVIQQQQIGEPILLWYTVSQTRKEKLEKWCKEYRVQCEAICKIEV